MKLMLIGNGALDVTRDFHTTGVLPQELNHNY